MKIIKNSTELASLLDNNKDLFLIDHDVRIEYQVTKDELRDVYCKDLTLGNDKQKFDFNGRDFIGRNFNGRDFNGWDFIGRNFNGRDFNGEDFIGMNFIGRDFNGWDFNGWDFNGEDFIGRKVSYYAFFNCLGSMTCESYEGFRTPHAEPVCLGGKIIKN